MRKPFDVRPPRRRTAVAVPAPRGAAEARAAPGGAVPGPPPEVSVLGLDPRTDQPPPVAAVHLTAHPGGPCPRSVVELLEAPGCFAVCHLAFDVRRVEAVLAVRGGRTLLEQLVARPADRVTNAVFRAAVAGDAAEDRGPAGDLDCEVRIVGEGDAVAGRCRVGLGRGRLAVMTLLTGSERAVRRLAEARAHPGDRAVRRRLERCLAEDLTTMPLRGLVAPTPGPPSCRVAPRAR